MSNTNKNKLIALTFFVIFPILLAEMAHSFTPEGFQVVSPVSPEILRILKLFFVIIASITFCAPWLFYKKIRSYQPKGRLLVAKFNVGNPGLMLGYSFIFSPVIYGLALFSTGMSIFEFYYFVMAAILGALAWGIFTFRRM